MTEAIQMRNNITSVINDKWPASTNYVGDIVSGELIEHSADRTVVKISGKNIELSKDIQVKEGVGETLDFEVVAMKDKTITLKYLEHKNQRAEEEAINKEIKKSIEVNKEYNKDLIKAISVMSADEVKSMEKLIAKTESDIRTIVDTMTNEDIHLMLEEGIDPEKLSLEMISKMVKSNKTPGKKYDLDAIAMDVQKALDGLGDKYKVDERLKVVVTTLKENDLPITIKHVDKILDALDKMDQISDKAQTQEQWINILKGGEVTTIDSLYKDTAMPILKDKPLNISEEELGMLVKQRLLDLDIDITDEAVETGKKMVKQDIPITKEAMIFALETKEIFEGIDEKEMVQGMADKIKNAEPIDSVEIPLIKSKPEDRVEKDEKEVIEPRGPKKNIEVTPTDSKEKIDLQVKQIMAKIASVTHSQVIRATLKNKDVSLRDIFEQDNKPMNQSSDDEILEGDSVDEKALISRHRQMEEIRLKMTMEAAMKLEKQGLNIETETLDKVVVALRSYEENMVKEQVYREEVASSGQEAVEKTIEAMASYRMIKHYKSEVAADVVMSQEEGGDPQAIGAVANKANNMGEQSFSAEVVAMAYEHSETQVRKDLGDRIEKTFDQIEPMLESMGIEPTEEAVKAVEILARNEMPITQENIISIQLVQEKVDYVTTRMNPRVVLEMVNNGITPMDLSLDETIEIIENYDRQFGETQSEKISRLIHDLLATGEIDEKQKDTLMGVYRAFDTVVRSKGAATGFLVKNDMPLNLSGLFDAAKYIRQTGQIKPVISADIDDGFGLLEVLRKSDRTIKEQIMTAIDDASLPKGEAVTKAIESLTEQGAEITKANVLGKMLMDVRLRSFVSNMTNEGMAKVTNTDNVADYDVRPLKALEKLLVEAVEADSKGSSMPKTSDQASEAKLNQILEVTSYLKNNPQLLKSLVNNDVPITTETVAKAMEINKEPFMLLDKLRDIMGTVDNDELKNSIMAKVGRTSEAILSGRSGTDAIKDMVHEIEKDLLASHSEGVTELTNNVTQVVKTVNQTQLLQITEDYYQIPIMMGNEMSQLNMYILSDSEDGLGSELGEINVVMAFKTRHLGDVSAYAKIKGNQLSLNIQSSDVNDRDLLKGFESQIKQIVEETNFAMSAIEYRTLEAKAGDKKGIDIETDNQKQPIKNSFNGFEIQI